MTPYPCVSRVGRRQLERAVAMAASSSPVLITGECGTGKSAFGELIHARSARSAAPMVGVACLSPPQLAQSDLFGHVSGILGSDKERIGAFRRADGSTLLLDGIGALDLESQAQVRSALETGEILPMGGAVSVRVDVRVIATTSNDLHAMVSAGEFRADLLHHLSRLELRLAPLRERREDIAPLAERYLEDILSDPECTFSARRFSPAAMRALRDHDWHGNLRELRNRVLRAAVCTEGPTIEPEVWSF